MQDRIRRPKVWKGEIGFELGWDGSKARIITIQQCNIMNLSRTLFGMSPPHIQPLTPVSEVSEPPESPYPYPYLDGILESREQVNLWFLFSPSFPYLHLQIWVVLRLICRGTHYISVITIQSMHIFILTVNLKWPRFISNLLNARSVGFLGYWKVVVSKAKILNIGGCDVVTQAWLRESQGGGTMRIFLLVRGIWKCSIICLRICMWLFR